MISRALPVTLKAARGAAIRCTSGTWGQPLPLLFTRQSWTTPSPVPSLFSPTNTRCTAVRGVRRETETGEMTVATLDDYQQVMSLCRNIRNGLDYLPVHYPHHVHAPGIQGFVYRLHGEVVGFFSSALLDKEQTAFVTAARIKESLQNQGISKEVMGRLIHLLTNRTLYPRVRRLKLTTPYSMKERGFRLLLRTYRADQAFDVSSLSQFTLKTHREQVTILEPNDVKQLFQSDPSCWTHLFPHKQFILARRPYEVMPENVPVILNYGWNTEFFGTKAADAGYSLLSAGSYFFCQLGICYEVDIFGNVGGETVDVARGAREDNQAPSDQMRNVRDHLITHLQRIKDMSHTLAGNVVFNVLASEPLEDVVVDVTQELKTFKICQEDDGFILWEYDIKGKGD